LVEHCHNVSFSEAWDMPVSVRKWWIQRKNKELRSREQRDERPMLPENPWVIKKDGRG
jgi:hypothetical protein